MLLVHCSYSPRPLTIFAEPVRVGLWPVAGGALEAEWPGDRAHDALPTALAPPAAVVSVARGAARVGPARHELVLLERGATGRYLGRGEEGREEEGEEEGEEEREGGQGSTHIADEAQRKPNTAKKFYNQLPTRLKVEPQKGSFCPSS